MASRKAVQNIVIESRFVELCEKRTRIDSNYTD